MADRDDIDARFKHDVRNHQMTIHMDQGLYRHLTFKSPGTINLHFHLVTWPGYLAISGDGPDFMFSRLADMFDFFRDSYEVNRRRIDHRYWAEKCCAECSSGGIKRFSEDAFREAVRRDLRSHLDGSGLTFAERRKVVERAQEDLDYADNIHDALDAAMRWVCPVTKTQPFEEFWDHDLTEYTYGFKWACRAIAWGVKQYDLHHAGRTQADHDRLVLKGAA